MTNEEEKYLGLEQVIPRRDFLQGASLGLVGLGAACETLKNQKKHSWGQRTTHASSFHGQGDPAKNLGHFVRERKHKTKDFASEKRIQTHEDYDLIVVGAGISGLAAAYSYRKQVGDQAKILILDNNSEIGGHARRNTFHYGRQKYIAHGGTFALESVGQSPSKVLQLFQEIGIDLEELRNYRDQEFFKKFDLSTAVLFDPRHLPVDKLRWVNGFHTKSYESIFQRSGLALSKQKELVRFYTNKINPIGSLTNKEEFLKSISWKDYILGHLKSPSLCLPFADLYASDLCGLACDAISAYEAYKIGPGFLGIGGRGFVEKNGIPTYSYQPVHRFPDGNHTVAKMLLNRLKPEVLSYPQKMSDVFNHEIDYKELDNKNSKINVRLNSMVVDISHAANRQKNMNVAVEYLHDHKVYRTRAKSVIMSGWGMAAKHIVPEMESQQVEALNSYGYCAALYINVLLKHWRPIAAIGAYDMYLPGGYCTWMNISDPLTVGSYQPPYEPDKPSILSMYKYLYYPGLSPREQTIKARYELESKSFSSYEAEIRRELNEVLGPWGFDARKDIAGMTINRWAHGYNFFKGINPNTQARLRGKKRIGNISFAGADAGGDPWTQTAIAEAIRAVEEQLP